MYSDFIMFLESNLIYITFKFKRKNNSLFKWLWYKPLLAKQKGIWAYSFENTLQIIKCYTVRTQNIISRKSDEMWILISSFLSLSLVNSSTKAFRMLTYYVETSHLKLSFQSILVSSWSWYKFLSLAQ